MEMAKEILLRILKIPVSSRPFRICGLPSLRFRPIDERSLGPPCPTTASPPSSTSTLQLPRRPRAEQVRDQASRMPPLTLPSQIVSALKASVSVSHPPPDKSPLTWIVKSGRSVPGSPGLKPPRGLRPDECLHDGGVHEDAHDHRGPAGAQNSQMGRRVSSQGRAREGPRSPIIGWW